jgi:hypothetical protein
LLSGGPKCECTEESTGQQQAARQWTNHDDVLPYGGSHCLAPELETLRPSGAEVSIFFCRAQSETSVAPADQAAGIKVVKRS